jgi:hypothetical protein
MLILIGIFDLGFGAAMAAASISLGQVAGEVSANSGLLHLGSMFTKITGGLVHFGSVDQGEAATRVLDVLPPVWISMVLAIGRMLLSACAIGLGIALARRLRSSLSLLMKWSLIACGWGIVAILANIGTYEFLTSTSGALAASVTVLVDLGLHVIWPLVVGWKVRLGQLS